MPFDFTTPSGLIPKGSAFGVLLFLQNKGELGVKGQKRGGILQLAPPPEKREF